jgi:hypothetical protein
MTSFMAVTRAGIRKKLNCSNPVGGRGGRTHWKTMESSKLGSLVIDFISHVNDASIAMESLKFGRSSSWFYVTRERRFHRYGISQSWVVL